MLVLVGCEESGVVTNAFRAAGHEAYSCDLEDTRGNPEWHIKGDVIEAITSRQWDLIILHPPCDALAVSGNGTYAKGKEKHSLRISSVKWTCDLWELAKKYARYVALENPIGVLFPVLKKQGVKVCYVQPHQHGHGETKLTGFALYNLPPITPTNEVEGREQKVWKMGPSPTRKRDRSRTYEGIAAAMVLFWGKK